MFETPFFCSDHVLPKPLNCTSQKQISILPPLNPQIKINTTSNDRSKATFNSY